MLIDEPTEKQEDQTQVTSEEQKPSIPDKYREKSLEDVIKMHQEAEKLIGKQAQEVGEVRKLADELIKQNLSSKQEVKQEEPEVDFFEDPRKAVHNTIDKHPEVVAARQARMEFKRMQIEQKLAQAHPDYKGVVENPDFQSWVKSSNVRLGLYAKADSEFDYDAADELLSTYKELRGAKAKQAQQEREQTIKTAQVDVGGSGESSRKIYRRADLIRLKMTDPDRYETLAPEIMQAYQEGRVK